MAKRTIKTTVKEIAEYWKNNISCCETELMFDWSDAEFCCWACGFDKRKYLQRCHIIPHALGGKDVPENYVLLCGDCHEEAPNVNNSTAMWDWLKEIKNTSPSMGLPMALGMMSALNKFGVEKLVKLLTEHDPTGEKYNKMFKNIGTHGFRKLTSSSIYYALVELEKELTQKK